MHEAKPATTTSRMVTVIKADHLNSIKAKVCRTSAGSWYSSQDISLSTATAGANPAGVGT